MSIGRTTCYGQARHGATGITLEERGTENNGTAHKSNDNPKPLPLRLDTCEFFIIERAFFDSTDAAKPRVKLPKFVQTTAHSWDRLGFRAVGNPEFDQPTTIPKPSSSP